MAVFTGLGSNTAPSFTFSSDTNTGIYSPGADQVAISTGGTGRLFIDSSGNVGIGISPASTLHVLGDIKSRNFGYLVSEDTGPSITLKSIGATASYGDVVLDANGRFGRIFFKTGYDGSANPSATRMTIDTTGNVLIGGTLPSAPNATITTSGNITATSIRANGSFETLIAGNTSITKTVTFASRKAILVFISFAFGNGDGNGTQRVYSLGVYTPGVSASTWTPISESLTQANTGNLTITPTSGTTFTVAKSAGSTSTSGRLVIQSLDLSSAAITVS